MRIGAVKLVKMDIMFIDLVEKSYKSLFIEKMNS